MTLGVRGPLGVRSSGGDLSVSVPLTIDSATATAVTVRRGNPASGTLQTWDLEYRESGAPSWTSWATGLTAETETVTGRTPETQYEFRATAHVLLDATAQASAETGELVGPPLTMWSAISGGVDFGSPIVGGGAWFWDEAVPGTFQAEIRNMDAVGVDAAQLLFVGTEPENAPALGFAVGYGGAWSVDNTQVAVPAGTFDSPSGVLSSVLPLSSPIAAGQSGVLQVAMGPGSIPLGKTFGDLWPESGLSANPAFAEGNLLGSAVSGIGIAPLQPIAFLRRASGPSTFNFFVFGDSTTAMVRPVAASNNTAKEGVWHFANDALRAEGKQVRIYSGGQGASEWLRILSRVRAALPWLAGKASAVVVQAWSWNSPWSTDEQAEAAWADYLVLEPEVAAAGFACCPLILNPYTTRNTAGQVSAFNILKAYASAHANGIVLDSILGGASWPDLIPAESEDNVHSNRDGGFRAGPLVAPEFVAVAANYYPELQ